VRSSASPRRSRRRPRRARNALPHVVTGMEPLPDRTWWSRSAAYHHDRRSTEVLCDPTPPRAGDLNLAVNARDANACRCVCASATATPFRRRSGRKTTGSCSLSTDTGDGTSRKSDYPMFYPFFTSNEAGELDRSRSSTGSPYRPRGMYVPIDCTARFGEGTLLGCRSLAASSISTAPPTRMPTTISTAAVRRLLARGRTIRPSVSRSRASCSRHGSSYHDHQWIEALPFRGAQDVASSHRTSHARMSGPDLVKSICASATTSCCVVLMSG